MIQKMNDHGKLRAGRSLARLWSGELSPQQAEALNPWDAEDSEYRQELISDLHLMADLDGLEGDEDILALVDTNQKAEKSQGRRIWLAAGGVVLAVAVGWWTQQSPEPGMSADIYRYVTRVGEVKDVELTDGSVVSLNTGTELLVTMTDTSRKITLVRGEAFFDVARDENRVFGVDAGAHSVTALGTKFNVRKYPDKLQVAVTEGLVALHAAEETPSGNSPLIGENKEPNARLSLAKTRQVRVAAGWHAEVDFGKQSIQGHAITANVATWKDGVLEFSRAPLVQVVAELNRYSGKKILIEDTTVMDLRVSAMFDIRRIDRALNGLEGSLPLKMTHYFDRIVITKREQ